MRLCETGARKMKVAIELNESQIEKLKRLLGYETDFDSEDEYEVAEAIITLISVL